MRVGRRALAPAYHPIVWTCLLQMRNSYLIQVKHFLSSSQIVVGGRKRPPTTSILLGCYSSKA